jgi:hypothetical protein
MQGHGGQRVLYNTGASVSHKILLLLALVGPILLIAAGGVAHVWGRRRKRLKAASQEPEKSN